MNANDLIEFQEDKASEARANGFSDVRFMQTATMLRQQQAEIEMLKAKMSLNSYDDSKNVAYQLFREKISLRNYFAAKAMQGLIAGCYSGNNSGFTVEGNVFAAYEYADEMMKVGKSD